MEPQTEEEAERMLDDDERVQDRINLRIGQEGPGANIELITHEEEERSRRESRRLLSPTEAAKREKWREESNAMADEWLRSPRPGASRVNHPLARRAFALSDELTHEAGERDWLPEVDDEDIFDDEYAKHPVAALLSAVGDAGGSIGSALIGYHWPPRVHCCASTIVLLRRAGGHLDRALCLADVCAEQNLGDAGWLVDLRIEVSAIAAECDRLIGELRALLARAHEG